MTSDPLLLLLVFAAPLPYWVAGLPWLAHTPAVPLAPAFGLGVVGWLAEMGLVTGLGATATVAIGLAASTVSLVFRATVDIRKLLATVGYDTPDPPTPAGYVLAECEAVLK